MRDSHLSDANPQDDYEKLGVALATWAVRQLECPSILQKVVGSIPGSGDIPRLHAGGLGCINRQLINVSFSR